MTAFCKERGLDIRECGKLVVTRSDAELPALEELLRRGARNGVEVHRVTEREARDLEPLARTHGAALWSPRTAAVEPQQVMRAMVADAKQRGVDVQVGVSYRGRQGERIVTSAGDWSAGYLVNAAGLYADRIARDFGFGLHYSILPFKGVYLKSAGALPLRRHVYPVPDPRYPFLGVHFTMTGAGAVKIGPTAIPALWREQYSGLRGFRAGEFVDIARRHAALLAGNRFDFRRFAATELRKYNRDHLVRLARELVPAASPGDFRRWSAPGIRAQLLDTRSGALEMDFVFEGDSRSMHVLNAVSPAFTCALPFAEYVVDATISRGAGSGAESPARPGSMTQHA